MPFLVRLGIGLIMFTSSKLYTINDISERKEVETIPFSDIWDTKTLKRIIYRAKKPKYILSFLLIVLVVIKVNLHFVNGG